RYPAGLPSVFTHHEVLRPRPFTPPPVSPGGWPGWAFGEIDWRRWAGFQRRAWNRFDLVEVFSRRDAETLAELAPEVGPRVRVDPFGLELPPAADPERVVAGTVLFVGHFAHAPNRDAAHWLAGEIMPAVRARFPTARLRIVGTAPPPEITGLAGPGVEVIADAPSVLPHLEEAAVVLAPVRTGGGMRMKVLQAMAAGKAVVTTPRGREGYDCFDEEPPLAIAADEGEIAATTATLLADDEGRRDLGGRARGFAERHLGPDPWARRMTAVYEEAVAIRAGGGGG
ncbi:MAG: glycosyltransferase family 4 protein, partial [Solirubrobacterales bacterium]